jgi:hypothetical protein
MQYTQLQRKHRLAKQVKHYAMTHTGLSRKDTAKVIKASIRFFNSGRTAGTAYEIGVKAAEMIAGGRGIKTHQVGLA